MNGELACERVGRRQDSASRCLKDGYGRGGGDAVARSWSPASSTALRRRMESRPLEKRGAMLADATSSARWHARRLFLLFFSFFEEKKKDESCCVIVLRDSLPRVIPPFAELAPRV